MDADAAIASGRQPRADARAIDEVELRRAGVFLQTKGHLEDARFHLERLELAVVDVHVAPLVQAELVLHLVVERPAHAPFDAHAAPRDVEGGVVLRD